MFSHQYQISRNPIQEFEQIELILGDLYIVFQEEKSGFLEGAWWISVTNRETKETKQLIDIRKLKDQTAYFQDLQNKDLPAFMAKLSTCGPTGITLNWAISCVLKKYPHQTGLTSEIEIKTTPRSPHSFNNLDDKAIAIKQALYSEEGFQFGNFTLYLRKPSKHSIYRHDLFYLQDRRQEKVKISIGNSIIAKIINWLKNYDISSLQDFLHTRGTNGRRMELALINQDKVPKKNQTRIQTRADDMHIPQMRLGK